jgi:hypothetical protein
MQIARVVSRSSLYQLACLALLLPFLIAGAFTLGYEVILYIAPWRHLESNNDQHREPGIAKLDLQGFIFPFPQGSLN